MSAEEWRQHLFALSAESINELAVDLGEAVERIKSKRDRELVVEASKALSLLTKGVGELTQGSPHYSVRSQAGEEAADIVDDIAWHQMQMLSVFLRLGPTTRRLPGPRAGTKKAKKKKVKRKAR
jgi:hypothetical protein